VVARVLDSVTKDAAEGFVREVVSNKVSLLATDESRVYGGLPIIRTRKSGTPLANTLSGGRTNTIEGFWSLFKRSIVGSYHKVSAASAWQPSTASRSA